MEATDVKLRLSELNKNLTYWKSKGEPMKRKILMSILLLSFIGGCQNETLRVSVAIEGIPVAHEGYNIGPELYLHAGQPAKVNGMIIWIDGLEPDTVLDSQIPNAKIMGR